MRIFMVDVDRTFSGVHQTTSTSGRAILDPYSFSPRIKSKNVEWVRLPYDSHNFTTDFNVIPDDINTVLWTDRSALFYMAYNTTIWTRWEYEQDSKLYNFKKPFPNKRNINIIMEPPDGCGETYNFIREMPEYASKFDLVLTHNRELCEHADNIKWYPWGTSLLDSEDQFQIYKKTKLVSANYSDKRWWSGHKFRYNLFEKIKTMPEFKFIDCTGPLGYIDYIPKLDTLKDYHYAIHVENQKVDDFFSDKIIDSFLTGTIPIYKGTNNIGNYFDKRGIITFDTEEELLDILRNLNTDFYYKNMDAITFNFNKAKKYVSPDDWILKTYGNEVFI